jgi:hypothetical protein
MFRAESRRLVIADAAPVRPSPTHLRSCHSDMTIQAGSLCTKFASYDSPDMLHSRRNNPFCDIRVCPL